MRSHIGSSTADASFFMYKTPLGVLTIASLDGRVTRSAFGRCDIEGRLRPTGISNECATQILQYCAGKRFVFDLPELWEGTDFQKKVWQAVGSVPYGQTRTCAEIAELIDEPSSYRLVGAAIKDNPLEVLIPTHRVIGSSGRASANDVQSKINDALRKIEARYS